jgi:putative flavoprotein involved in K+ transport
LEITMERTTVVVIGAGQAGLAVSHQLRAAAVEHVVLERGRTAQVWRSERWDSLRLLTPNWMTRLPGWSYQGADQAGFMTATQVADFLEDYARSFDAPIVHQAQVRSVTPYGGRYLVHSDAGSWVSDAVVIATGYCAEPAVPAFAAGLDPAITQLTPDRYRNPGDVPSGGVLIIGASSTGVQHADELATAGHDVTVAVGRHIRLPRRYRGMDIMWWLETMGSLDRPASSADRAAVSAPSLQLVGRNADMQLDLPTLAARGVQFTGRVSGVEGTVVGFADDLGETTAAADAQLEQLLGRIDRHAALTGLVPELDRPSRPVPSTPVAARPRIRELDLHRSGIRTVLWATGCRRSYPWLHLPVLDAAGEIRHAGGLTSLPGIAVVGMRWQTRRKSTLIDGVRHDATKVVDELVNSVLPRSGAQRRAA